MMALLLIPFCAWLNRFRGGGWPGHIIGGPAVVPSILLGLAVWPLYGVPYALISFIGYLFWAIWGWGAYHDMGRSDIHELEIDWIDKITRPLLGNDFAGDLASMALRQFYAAPFFLGAFIYGVPWWVFPIFVITVPLCYVVPFRLLWPYGLFHLTPTALAELATGAIWGAAIASATP